MNLRVIGLTGAMALVVGCGSSPSKTAAQADATGEAQTNPAPTAASTRYALTSSKIAQQSTASSQTQADQSETATSGADDGSGTSKRADRKRGGQLGIDAPAGITLTGGPITADFNVTLDFNAYLGPNAATSQGRVHGDVRHGPDGDCDVVLTGSITESFSGSRDVKQATNPNVHIVKKGTRAAGKVVRQISGFVRRSLADAQDANNDFDLSLDHTGTLVTDLYADNALTTRTLQGTVQVVDAKSGAMGTVTFNNVTRPDPAQCLCPTSGTITVALTRGTNTEVVTHTFSSTCGVVGAAGSIEATVASKLGNTETTTTAAASSDTSVSSGVVSSNTSMRFSEVVNWPDCLPN